MITPKQKECLDFIASQQASGKPCPSYDEIAYRIGLASKSGVHRLVTALIKRGLVRRIPCAARSLEVVRMPTAARSINKVHAVMEVRAALEALNKNDPNVAKYARAAISRLIQLGVQFEDAA